MIKFFRNLPRRQAGIRKKLLSESKFSRYLIYALGEIVLVVIGILIALNINNRKELSKLNTQEIKILRELVVNLRSDSLDHSANMDWYDNTSKSAAIVVNSLESRIPWNDTLASHYGWIFMKGLANLNTSS